MLLLMIQEKAELNEYCMNTYSIKSLIGKHYYLHELHFLSAALPHVNNYSKTEKASRNLV